MIAGSPISATTSSASSIVWALPDAGTSRPMPTIAALNCSRSSAVAIAVGVGAEHLRRPGNADDTGVGTAPWRGSARSARRASAARRRAVRVR